MISFTYLVTALTAVGLIAVGALLPWQPPAQAAAGTNKTLTFSGRLYDITGAVVPDGTYNMEFKIYCDGDGLSGGGADPGSCSGSGSAEHLMWTEDWVYGPGVGGGWVDNRVKIRNGYYSVSLGSICAFTSTTCTVNNGNGQTNSVMDWNQTVLWISMNIGDTTTAATFGAAVPNGEMFPMRRFTAAAYAQTAAYCSSCILQAPTSTAQNTIAPTTNSVVALTVKGTTGTAANVLEVFDSTGTPTRQAFFDNTGALNVAKAIQPTTNNTVDVGLSGTAFRTGYFATSVVTPLVNAAAALALQSGSGSSISATPGGTGDVVINTDADSQLQVTQGTAAPGVDQITVTNAGFGVTSTDVSNLRLSFTGGAAAVEAGAEYISLNPSATSGSTWNGLKVVHNTTGPATGVTTNGAKFVGPTAGGAGTYNAINVNSIGNVASGGTVRGVNITGTNSQGAGNQTGINLNNLTPAGAIETGVNVGHGWDSAIQVQATAAFTQTTAQTGINLDYNTTFTGATGQNITGLSMSNPTSLTVTSATAYTGINLGATAGSYTSNGGNFTYTGLKVTNPNLTQTANVASATGASLTTGTLTTGGSQTGLGITASGVGVGSLTGVAIGAITNGASTAENAMTVGSGWDNILFYNGATSLINGSGQWNLGQVTGTLAVNRGGTGQTSYVNGELLIGNTATGLLNKATLTPTANRLSVTNGTGSITLNVDATQFPNSATNGDVFRSSAANTGQWIAPTFANGMCSDCLTKTPSSTGVNTITPTGSTTGLTVNGSATATLALNVVQGQAADGVNVTTSAAGTNANGLLVSRSAAGTTTNALAVTNATGTTTNGLAITQSSGTLTNGVSFAGTIGTDITRASGTLTLQGAGGINFTAGGAAQNIALNPGTTGDVIINGTNPTLAYSGNAAAFLKFAASGTTNGNLLTIAGQNATSGTGGGITIQGGTATTGAGGTLTLSGGNTVAAGTNGAVSIDAGSGATTPNGTVTIAGSRTTALNIGKTSGALNSATTFSGRSVLKPGVAGNASNSLVVQNTNAEPLVQIDTTTPNLLLNSGFEPGTTNWVAKGTTSSFATDNTGGNVYHGQNSLKAIVTAANSGVVTTGGQAAFSSAIAGETQYQLTFMAKCSGTFATLTYGYQNNGADINAVTTGNCTTAWQQFTAHWTTAKVIINPNVFVTLGSTAAGTLWVDAMTLVQTTNTVATPYDVGNILNGGIFSNPAQFQNTNDSTSAFQVQNAAGTRLFGVDTVGGNVLIGQNSTASANLQFTNAGSAQVVGLNAAYVDSSYSLVLPTTVATTGQCVTSTTAGSVVTLAFGSCGSGNAAATSLNNLTVPTAINADLSFATGANRKIQINTAATTTFTTTVLGQTAGGSGNQGGTVALQGGTGTTTGLGGQTNLWGGTGGSTGVGGAVTVNGGSPGATGSAGGDVVISGGSKGSGSTPGKVVFQPQASNDTTTAIQIQNAAGTRFFTADTTNGAMVLGATSTTTGKIKFANSAASSAVTLQAGGTTASYTLTLPTATSTPGDCVKALSGAGALSFTACGNAPGANPGNGTAITRLYTPDTSYTLNSTACNTSVTLANTPTVGNLLVAYYSNGTAGGTGAVSLPAGWTAAATAYNGTASTVAYMAYRTVQAGDTTGPYTFGYTNCASNSGVNGVMVEEWSGVTSTTDGTGTTTTAQTSTPYASASITTTQGGDLVLSHMLLTQASGGTPIANSWAYKAGTASTTWMAGASGSTAIGNRDTGQAAYTIPLLAGTYGAENTPTNHSGNMNSSVIVAFKAAGATGGGVATPTKIQSTQSTQLLSAGCSISMSYSGSPVDGNVLIAHFVATDANNSAVVKPSGWTTANNTFNGSDFSAAGMAYRVWHTGDPYTSLSFGWSTCNSSAQTTNVVIEEWSGLDGTVDVTAVGNTNQTPASAYRSPAVTTTNANDFVIALIGTAKNTAGGPAITTSWAASPSTVATTWTSADIGNSTTGDAASAVVGYAIGSSTGTYGGDPGASNSISKSYARVTAAFRIANGAGGGGGGVEGTVTLQSTYTPSTGGTTPEIKVDTTRNGVDIQDANFSVSGTILAVRKVNSSGLGAPILDVTSNGYVQVGANTTDTSQVNLQLDSFSTFADTGTCDATTNQGAMYFNTATASIRTCHDAAWEDVISTRDAKLLMFGVVPDSGPAGEQGDLASVTDTTNLDNGPCKVSVGTATNIVSWKGCVAYSGGRRVVVTAGTLTTTNGTGGNFQHLCLTGTGNQPALSTSAAEATNQPTFSTTAPILCLADIRFNAANNTITQLWDVRTYTTTTKMFATVITTAPVLGQMVKTGTTTPGSVTATTGTGDAAIMGVVVASSGATSTTTINAIVATYGPAAVKAITGTNIIGDYVAPTGTAGRANTAAAPTSTFYGVLGVARTVWTGATACVANRDACQSSVLVNIVRR